MTQTSRRYINGKNQALISNDYSYNIPLLTILFTTNLYDCAVQVTPEKMHSISATIGSARMLNHPKQQLSPKREDILQGKDSSPTTKDSRDKDRTKSMAKKFMQRAISNMLQKDHKKSGGGGGALLPNGMPRKWRSCDYEGCDYSTQYKANLNRHKNHYGHHTSGINITDEDMLKEKERSKKEKSADEYDVNEKDTCSQGAVKKVAKPKKIQKELHDGKRYRDIVKYAM